MSLAIYGRTYLDAEVTVDLASLATGKGKVDTEVVVRLGGFACNATRAVVGRLPAHEVRVVTAIAQLDLPRLRAELPAEIVLDPIVTGSLAWPPVSVIVNPAAECRLLRVGDDRDAEVWKPRPASLAAEVQLVGRLPRAFYEPLLGAGIFAWCGGDADAAVFAPGTRIACLNTAEARRVLGRDDGGPRELATAIARRCGVGAVRVVTGRGQAPSVAAVNTGEEIACYEATPSQLAPDQVRRLKGVGDVFAARFVVEACFDEHGALRPELAIEHALGIAQAAAGAFITRSE